MYHLYLLLARNLNGLSLIKNPDCLISGNDFEEESVHQPNEEFFWIGLYEIAPLIAGIILSENLKSFIFPLDYLSIGIIVSIIIGYIFRNDVPDQPISFKIDESVKKYN